MGGLSNWVSMNLEEHVKNHITPAKGDALTGAIQFAKTRNEA
jgi:hypothetical protein